jgi:plasmid stability protein
MSTTKLLQVRNVPADVHMKLKIEAANKGKSLSDLLLDIILKHEQTVSIDDWLAEVRRLPKTKSKVSAADVIRAARGPL